MNMKIKLAMGIGFLLFIASASGQSKVFKAVSEDISSDLKIITQDEALIGYLVFTRLEKASKDSFNYQISIMDENLNDIGKLDFREKNLELQAVSFEQDVLCLAYVKSEITDLRYMTIPNIKKSFSEGKYSIFTQLINLEGQVVYSGSEKVDLIMSNALNYLKYNASSVIAGNLKHRVLLKNVPGKGFALFYGDQTKIRLQAFDITGKKLWQETVPESNGYRMLTTPSDIYLLTQKVFRMQEGGYDIKGYNSANGKAYDRYALMDKKGNELKVLGFEIDPATGRPNITGMIINKKRGNGYGSVMQLRKGTYDGVFTIALNGPNKADILERFSYWQDGSKEPEISKTGYLTQTRLYPHLTTTLSDYKGNTYFAGSSYTRKTKVGGIITGIVLSPLFIPTLILYQTGTHKSRQADVILFKQDTTGSLRYENSIDGKDSKYLPSKAGFGLFDHRNFYTVRNAVSKSNFLIVDENDETSIYNIENRKVVRKVPHWDGKVRTSIYPAKEGHIMVVEFNKSAKETKLSIESLQ